MDKLLRAHIIKKLYESFTPHKGQKQILKWIFTDQIKRILAINGRNWGKTEDGLHCLARGILTREGLHKSLTDEDVVDSYYVAPNIAHARRIVWDNKRLQQLIPSDFILEVHKNDRMIYLTKNGKDCCGWIKIEGAENIWSLVGVKHKGMLVIDETYMIEKAFLDAHEEDLAAYTPPILLFSTWPIEYPHWIDKLAKEYENSDEWKFMNRPSMDNIFLEKKNPGYFVKQKLRYELRGDLDGYRREILSERVISSGASIFPNFNCQTYIEACNAGFQDEDTLSIRNRESYQEIFINGPKKEGEHVFPDPIIRRKLEPNKKDLIPIIAVDPGHASKFATLFLAINPYSKDIFFLDEIYEGNRNLISTTTMLNLMFEKSKVAFPWATSEEIRKVCDEAALWFRMEAVSISQMAKGPTKGETFAFVATQKASYKHEYGYSMMKAAMNMQKFFVSDKCPYFIWEIINHRSDDKGKIPTKDDHLLDCCRYALALTKYLVSEEDKDSDKGMFDDDELGGTSLISDMMRIRSDNGSPWSEID